MRCLDEEAESAAPRVPGISIFSCNLERAIMKALFSHFSVSASSRESRIIWGDGERVSAQHEM